ncbi:MAG TPA: hypothetical protein DHL02_20145 [Achromobacter sp.]|nr:hypothetical protein [Achromobacter sp.]
MARVQSWELTMSDVANTHTTPSGIPCYYTFIAIEKTTFLSTSARQSLFLLARRNACPTPAMIQYLMFSHDWTEMRAWRHWRGHSKAEAARRVGVQVSTYELIEDGTVDLGPFLQPKFESALLEASLSE